MTNVLAHGGGLPEALSVLVPLVIAVLLLRAGSKAKDDDEDEDEDVSS